MVFFTFELSWIELALLAALAFFLLAHLYAVIFVHAKLVRYKVNPLYDNTAQKPLSVIIAARNEAENLNKFLLSILEQDYPDFEVIVVDDRSYDETSDVLRTLSSKYTHLKVVKVNPYDNFLAGKKFAVAMGIKAAKNEWLVFTDADCEPSSNQWLKLMQKPEENGKEILLGYSPYFRRKGFLNLLIRFETFYTAINYLSFALKGNPYMGVGRNMAYQKDLFFKSKGFATHMHIPSGDDDLFVNANANSTNTSIQIHPDSQVWTEPKTTFKSYFRQKRRHIGAGKLYKSAHKRMLSAQLIFQFGFFGFLIASLCFTNLIYIALAVFLLSVIVKLFVYPNLFKKLSYPDLSWWFPIMDIVLVLFLVINAILSIFAKKNVAWK